MNPTPQLLPDISKRAQLLAHLPEPATRRAIRERAGYTLQDFGDACDVTASTVHGWEHGRTPSRHALRPYVRLLEHLAGIDAQ
jgi:DNA-binding transcriptional regulator YiaG